MLPLESTGGRAFRGWCRSRSKALTHSKPESAPQIIFNLRSIVTRGRRTKSRCTCMPKLISQVVRFVGEKNEEMSLMGVLLSLRVAAVSLVLVSIPLLASVAILA